MTKKISTSMYRQAALDAHFMQQYGKAALFPSYQHAVLAAILICWFVLGLLLISIRPFYETIEVSGWLESSEPNINVRSQASAGTVSEVYVKNGQYVEKGQKIAKIIRSKGVANGQYGIAQQLKYQQQESSHQIAIYKQRLQQAQVESAHIVNLFHTNKSQLTSLLEHQEAHSKQLYKSTQRYTAMQALANQGSISLNQLEQNELQVLSLEQGKLDLSIQIQNLQKSLQDLEQRQRSNTISQQQIQHELSAYQIKSQQHRQALQDDMFYIVRAPNQGQINHLQAYVGASVRFSQNLTQIIPAQSQYKVKLALPAFQAAFVKSNQQVSIKVNGFPYQKYGALKGHISIIAQDVLLPEDVQNSAVPIQQAVYLVDVNLHKNAPSSPSHNVQAGLHDVDATLSKNQILLTNLRAGMTVQASINKHQTTILQWLLSPLLDSMTSTFTSDITIDNPQLTNDSHQRGKRA